MSGIAVMLHPSWPMKEFGRVVRDEDGKQIERLTFKRGEALLLNDDQFSFCMGDIGKALAYSHTDKAGKPTHKPDLEATKADAPK
jgi:hypothetical protein